jgi:3-methyladenine DNA glycosylase/8-oxoguanine DNA glycosylase
MTDEDVDKAKDYVIKTFRLKDDLERFYEEYKSESIMEENFKSFYGMRLMHDQDPFETLITGICSQHASIQR